jgi:putative hydrolase of the HAD superfamily
LAALPQRGNGSIDSARYFALFADAPQGVSTAADVQRINDASLSGEYPDINRVLDTLEAVSIDTAVLSNTNDAHWARLFTQTPGEPEFPTLVRAQDRFAIHLLGVEKSDPRAYRHVERATGHAAHRILYFDDLLDNVEGARVVGWTAELIDYTGDSAAQTLAILRRRGVVD